MKLCEKKLGREKALGMADTDSDGRQVVLVDPRQPSRERLDTLLHEGLHHLCPGWSEGKVRRAANRLRALLWKDGWRRIEK